MEIKEYLTILEQGLMKKSKLLESILEKCKEQKQMLLDENLKADDFECNMNEKAALIEELTKLDAGFEQVYERIRKEIMSNQEQYKEEIHRLQELITKTIGLSTSVQSEEARNKMLAQEKFSKVKKQIREVKSSQKVVNQYYQSMMKGNYVDSQFLDNKK